MADYIPIGNWNNQDESGTVPEGSTPLSAEKIKYIEGGITGSLQKSGGVMTGGLTLAEDPQNAMDAVTKQYADTNIKRISLTGISWINRNTSVGKIPDFDASKYTVVSVDEGSWSGGSGSLTVSRLVILRLNEWNKINAYDNAVGGSNSASDIKIDSLGNIFFKKALFPEYLFLIPMETVSLIK